MARGGRKGRPKHPIDASRVQKTPVAAKSVEKVVSPASSSSNKEPNETPIPVAVAASSSPSSTVPEPSSPVPELPRPTYASLLDEDEGTHLRYIPAQVIDGRKCAQIEREDVASEIEYWQSAVLCSVLGANPPLEVMKGYINRIWGNYEIDKIILVKRGLFLVRFAQLQDKQAVEKRGVYFFDRKPFLVKGWNPEMDLHTESIRSLPLWVHFPDLDLKYWGFDCLSKIGSLLGIPLKTDRITREKSMIGYARLLIEVPMEGPFPDFIEFFDEYGVLVHQPVKFEWKPCICEHCGLFGHLEDACRKKKPRMEWRPVNRAPTIPQSIPDSTPEERIATPEAPIISVPKHSGAKPSNIAVQPASSSNAFLILQHMDGGNQDVEGGLINPPHG